MGKQLTGYDKFIQQALKYGFSLFGLPKTAQTVSYATGDDGTYQKGYPKTGAQFVDNGDGTITDNGTGLMWIKDPVNNPGAPFNAQMTWANALINCEALNFAGHTDWRLPNIKELMSIIDYSEVIPAVDGTFFPNTKNAFYWSSTTWKITSFAVWITAFDDGSNGIQLKTSTYYVRPVRLGKP